MNFIAVAVILFGAVPSVMPGGVRVKAPLGGNATIHCSYDPGSEKYPKYFSKGQQKTELVRQDRRLTWSRDWRFSLEDDTETRVFTVTMRNLSVDDAGVYWCGVDRWISDIQTEVTLDVVQHVVHDETTQNVPGIKTDTTGSFTEDTVFYSSTGIGLYVGGVFGAVLLVFSVILCVFKGNEATTFFNTTVNMKEFCKYEATPYSSPASESLLETTVLYKVVHC
ncbi:polymeric immunoglobulin receptor-like isoform X1 [Silurus meridionalis]|nr:polymeric immunoglobulin receptor-like isoform X1 [Silurus meridionalis]